MVFYLTVSDILERLAAGEKLADISASLGQSSSWLQRRLKGLGYAWDNSAKLWFYVLDGEQPLDASIDSRPVHKGVKSVSRKERTQVNLDVQEDSHPFHKQDQFNAQLIHSQFTEEEVRFLKDFVRRRTGDVAIKLDLVERAFLLPREDKERRTVLGIPSLLVRLDRLAERTKIDKSDLWAIALHDFLDRYDTD